MSKICRRHFEAKYIREDGKRVPNGAPTLFTKEEIESGIPSKPLPSKEPEKLINEHNYSFKAPRTDHNYSQKFDGLDQETTDIDNCPDDNVGDNPDWQGDAEPEVLIPDPTDTNYIRTDGLKQTRTPLRRIQPENQYVPNPQRIKKNNEVQYFMDEFIREIQSDIDYQAPEDIELPNTKRKFADELKTYNFTSEVIFTNRHVKPYDKMEDLMYSEKAYAAITFCLLKQQDLFEESIHDFLMWAAKSEITYEILEKKVAEIFENGEFIQISQKILQIICKYRMKNIEIRKLNIADQALDPEIKESLSKIPHSSTRLFNEDDLLSTLNSAPSINKLFAPNSNVKEIKLKSKHDRAVQVNILPRKYDKVVQVKPKKARKAVKRIQVNSNELESIATAKKVKKKNTGSQTTEKDKLLSATMVLQENPPLRERSEIIQDSPISHCQKIQYVVNIKRKLPRHDDEVTNPIKYSHSVESNVQAGPKYTNFPQFQHVPSDSSRLETNNETRQDQNIFNKSKKRKTTKGAAEPSVPALDTCQNLLSLAGESNPTETETERVHSTLERKSPKRGRPNFGKKRRPKIPDTLKGHNSPIKSTGTLPMRGMSDSFQVPGQSTNTLHVCDSPYLLGGCKHTYDPKSESVPSRIDNSLKILKNSNQGFSGGKRPQYDIYEPTRSIHEEVPRDSYFHESSPVVVQAQNPTNPSSPMHLLSYDNLLSRWAS